MTARKYYIIGVGPGDPDLMSIRAVRSIQESDLILYDSLIPEDILIRFCSEKKKIHVGHRSSKDHHDIMERISDILDNTEDAVVAHLKSGDPAVFSHLHEEVDMLVHRGISYEIVPGISSAIAVPEMAGIALTGRGFSE
ncbi:SAM-dependent methyltransferase [Thermoplasma sp.]|nr:SAM-dependent methyltransferase [Thermoplasma sp.]